ncbi:MAG: hypothetical protein AAF501_09530 [Pseudomonadota bacterium]
MRIDPRNRLLREKPGRRAVPAARHPEALHVAAPTPAAPNGVWSMGVVADRLEGSRLLRILDVPDE